MNLKISDNFNEIKTNNKITQVQPSDYELLTYEEAIEKAGGFGTYQSILFVVSAILCSYGSQQTYNIGLLTNALDYECAWA